MQDVHVLQSANAESGRASRRSSSTIGEQWDHLLLLCIIEGCVIQHLGEVCGAPGGSPCVNLNLVYLFDRD